jgi:hypothetical protein
MQGTKNPAFDGRLRSEGILGSLRGGLTPGCIK